ncbi:MAG TPA: hypothetical protein VNZ68_08780, partial [Rhodocyclaceae bacterium]|nr:hypothetical protein [Rhodocyclaceae bacterium]
MRTRLVIPAVSAVAAFATALVAPVAAQTSPSQTNPPYGTGQPPLPPTSAQPLPPAQPATPNTGIPAAPPAGRVGTPS